MHGVSATLARRFAMVRCGPIAAPSRATAEVDGHPWAGIFGNAVVGRFSTKLPGQLHQNCTSYPESYPVRMGLGRDGGLRRAPLLPSPAL